MSITLKQLETVIKKLCETVVENEVYFCDLDAIVGDGNLGTCLATGFSAVLEQWGSLNRNDISTFIKSFALIISNDCGAPYGAILGSAFRNSAKNQSGKTEISTKDIIQMFASAVDNIRNVSDIQPGDKTLLDALIPAIKAMRLGIVRGESTKRAFELAADAAVIGAENTKSMTPKKGKPAYLGERSLSYPDAGAVAVAVIFKSFVD